MILLWAGVILLALLPLTLIRVRHDCEKQGHEFVGYEAGRHCVHCGKKP